MVVVVVVDSFFREFDATKLDHTKKLTPPPKERNHDRKSDPPQVEEVLR